MSQPGISTKAAVSLTDGAIEQILAIRKAEEIPAEHGLRVGVEGGGCAGFSYILGFDERRENDEVFMIEDIQVFMNKAHALHLLGMEIDWLDGLHNKGFVFNNPNV
jgi:iron-sulfur cluster assembly protein